MGPGESEEWFQLWVINYETDWTLELVKEVIVGIFIGDEQTDLTLEGCRVRRRSLRITKP